MNLLKKIFAFAAPFKIQDDFFGELLYFSGRSPHIGYWEGKKEFAPAKKTVELFIDAPAPRTAPNEAQRQFFKEVESRCASLLETLQSALTNYCKREQIGDIPTDISKLAIAGFDVPLPGKSEWRFLMESKDEEHHYEFIMNGWAVDMIVING